MTGYGKDAEEVRRYEIRDLYVRIQERDVRMEQLFLTEYLVERNDDRKLYEGTKYARERPDTVILIQRHCFARLRFFVILILFTHMLELRLDDLHAALRLKRAYRKGTGNYLYQERDDNDRKPDITVRQYSRKED